MSDSVITADLVGKRFSIGHGQRADTLRDSLARKYRHLAARLKGRSGADQADGDEFWALKDVCFDIGRGDVVGIIGRNGAGKSTLLKILSRITEPTVGKVRLRGRVASLLEVGTGFHPELTGRDNIFLNGAILGMNRSEIASKFDAIVAFAEVERFLDMPVKHYSSGMYVRLAFAVAAHLEPEILIVDEVLAVGDYAFQQKCLGKMGEVAGQDGRTVLFVSHNMGAVRGLCRRCVWLEQGRVREVGEAGPVVDRYLLGTSQASRDRVDLDASTRDGHLGTQLRVTGITFNDGEPIRHGEPLSAVVEFDVKSPVSDVSLGVGFSTIDGVRIMSLDSDQPGPRLQFKAPGRCRVRVAVDRCLLQPGVFAVDIGSRSGDFHALDYLGAACLAEVIPGPTTPSTLVRDRPHVRYPSDWRLTA